MNPRQNQGLRPQITFTADFHELVQGDLVPGPCLLRYDPLRLIPADEAGEHDHEIRAYLRFHPSGQTWEGTLLLQDGAPVADLAHARGQNFVLKSTFEIPAGTDEIEAWFSCTHEDGYTHWDSNEGKNHWLRFSLHDIKEQQAVVRPPDKRNPAQSALELDVLTIPQVHTLTLRWRLPAFPERPRFETPLVATGETKKGKRWGSPEEGIFVPVGAVVAYDLVYYVGDRKFTDDNQGRWYLSE
jgi:hypothetical protein